MTTDFQKQEIYNFLLQNKGYSSERYFKRRFNDVYVDIENFEFTDFELWKTFKFPQKLFHYLHNDTISHLCKCGNVKSFISLFQGYKMFCKHTCEYRISDWQEKLSKSNLEKYGSENIFSSQYGKQKIKETVTKNYGGFTLESKELSKKAKQTCFKKYGVENYSKTEECINKIKQSKLEHYDNENYNNSPKSIENNKKNHNGIFSTSVPEIQKRIIETKRLKYGNNFENIKEKSKRTCLEKYGVENYSSSLECKEKVKQTCLEKYGVENYSQTNEYKQYLQKNNNKIQGKIYKTKKKNNTFNTSKIELQLKQYFKNNNIIFISQYKDERYPFACDFYFPEKDLFVEIQGSWTHGNKPFNIETDLTIVQEWLDKNSKYYDNAIETWTVRDVKKRKTAIKNNLNYFEIFSIDFEYCSNFIMNILK